MTLYKRGSVWWVKATRGGVRVQKTTGTTSKAEARKFADGLELATHAPTFDAAVEFLRVYYGDAATKQISLDAAWAEYEKVAKSVGRVLCVKSARLRREKFARFVKWIRENRNGVAVVEKVDGPCAAAFAAHLVRLGLKSKTRQNIISELGTVWTMLGKVSPNLQNPWRGLSPRDTDSQRLDAFTPAQVDALADAARKVGHDWWLAVKLGAETGLRYGDIANLRWESVDLSRAVIHLCPQKTASHGIEVAIPIVDAEVLAELKKRRISADSAHYEPDTFAAAYVMPEHAAQYGDLGRGSFKAVNFRSVMDAAGISGNYTFHSLRHTFRSRLAAAGVSTETAMRLCGHTSEAMSAHYDHDPHLDESRRAIEAAICQGGNKGAVKV